VLIYLLITHVLLPLVLIVWLGLCTGNRGKFWLFRFGIVTAYCVFIAMVGVWGAISYYLPVLYALLYVSAVVRSYKKLRRNRRKRQRELIHHPQQATDDTEQYKQEKWVGTVKSSILVILLLLDGWVLWGYEPTQKAIELNFPLTGGIYYVWNGGHSPLINQCPFYAKQHYGLDIVKLNRAGVSTRSVPAGKLVSFEIFGEIVRSPCDGTVVNVVAGKNDHLQTGKLRELDTGNMVALQCAGVTLYFLHLQFGSVTVKPGQILNEGE